MQIPNSKSNTEAQSLRISALLLTVGKSCNPCSYVWCFFVWLFPYFFVRSEYHYRPVVWIDCQRVYFTGDLDRCRPRRDRCNRAPPSGYAASLLHLAYFQECHQELRRCFLRRFRVPVDDDLFQECSLRHHRRGTTTFLLARLCKAYPNPERRASFVSLKISWALRCYFRRCSVSGNLYSFRPFKCYSPLCSP